MNYKTSYHESLGCEPTTVFHGRIPYNIFDIKLGLKPKWKKDNNEELTEELQKQIAEIHQASKEHLMQSYLKHKQYYDSNTELSNTEFTMGPEDCLEVDILPNLPSSNGFQHIITMMDVFSRYLFAYPTQDMTARTVARCIIDVMTRHCYLPTVILTDKGSQFRSKVVNRIAQTLDIRIIHASTKHAQTIGILERTHASLKTSLKMSTGEKRSMWHKYVQIAFMNYTTSYHESLGFEPTTVFHGRIPYNILDIKLGLKPKWKKDNNEELTEELQKQIAEIHQASKEHLMQSYLKHKQYYDKKATATLFKVNDYCYVLTRKRTTSQ